MFCIHFRFALPALTMPEQQTKVQCENLLLEVSCLTRSGVVTWLDLKHLLDNRGGGKELTNKLAQPTLPNYHVGSLIDPQFTVHCLVTATEPPEN